MLANACHGKACKPCSDIACQQLTSLWQSHPYKKSLTTLVSFSSYSSYTDLERFGFGWLVCLLSSCPLPVPTPHRKWERHLDKTYMWRSEEGSCFVKWWVGTQKSRFFVTGLPNPPSQWTIANYYMVFWLIDVGYRNYHLLLSASLLSLGESLYHYMCSLADPGIHAVL